MNFKFYNDYLLALFIHITLILNVGLDFVEADLTNKRSIIIVFKCYNFNGTKYFFSIPIWIYNGFKIMVSLFLLFPSPYLESYKFYSSSSR